MKRGILLSLVITGCAARSIPQSPEIAHDPPSANTQPAFVSFEEEDARFDRDFGRLADLDNYIESMRPPDTYPSGDYLYTEQAEVRLHDREWYRWAKMMVRDGYPIDEAVASANKMFGTPSYRWPKRWLTGTDVGQ